MRKLIGAGVLVFALMGCSMAPTYHRPTMPVPEHFKEPGAWVEIKSTPRIVAPDGWWQAFNDPVLNDLENQLNSANQDLKLAYAHFQESISLVQVARSYFFPTIQGLFNADRQQSSRTVANPVKTPVFNQFLLGGFLAYELDAWGSVRNSVIASERNASASAADAASIRLSLQAELANDYFALRGSDEAQRILDTTVIAYQKALYLTKNRYRGGAAPIADVDEAETQLENAKTMAADMRLQRAQLEHAIAVLVGEIPSNFSLPPAQSPKVFLEIAPNIPSTLLERRPDIVAAESRVQAANANIGVARAAFFPVIDLSGSTGVQSKSLANLISKPSLFWSLGPLSLLTLTQPVAQVTIFDGGRLRGLLNQAKAQYFETVATYRQTVLTAFQEVEDNLIAVHQLDQEYRSQEAATRAAKRAWDQELYRYKGGLVTFLQVVVVENTALQSKLALVNIHTRRQIASIQLIKALGGGWSLDMGKKG
ncbi:efflux transporter outer membrane subunit [Fluoribacter gormanii]|uniref:Efflux transporter, outer membrane factor (OMF) lipoprotein, NodT family n=1 Tax=Fluoribacter gormanii TaxID=464 RepID=A0A377GM53_9GAMM|nr:efflux transporter outer membrane subunit [Fluoribacter gormanii]KTD05734.1 outer membrane efflux protein [Fluoribacter gormanii]SIQ61808.1 efflux transporter, outer membrane factor (OMF) lipoprotein, NodT family [Fluoribacter gormanii]STO25910.1 Probable efflux pump outer membrane protein ttgC precursor [Fluoribacter gormanii]